MEGLQAAFARARWTPRTNGHTQPTSPEIEKKLAELQQRIEALEAANLAPDVKLSTPIQADGELDRPRWKRKCLDCSQEFMARHAVWEVRCDACLEGRRIAKVRARVIYNEALRSGTLVPQPCEICGTPGAEGHHDDYAKPIDVRWLCRAHHLQFHSTESEQSRFLDRDEPASRRRPTIREIIKAVCKEYRVSDTDLLSERRTQPITFYRQIAMYLCTRLTFHALPAIGRLFFRDHTTVLSAREKIAKLRHTDENLRAQLTAFEEKLFPQEQVV